MFSSINAETRQIVECLLAPSTIWRASALCLKSSYLHIYSEMFSNNLQCSLDAAHLECSPAVAARNRHSLIVFCLFALPYQSSTTLERRAALLPRVRFLAQ